MSIRQQNQGSIVKPGFNPLGTQTTTILYNLYGWGSNVTYGQLGLGNRTNYSSPKQVGSLVTWASISSAFYSSASIKTDGTLWTWGSGEHGQLGLNNRTYYSSPKQVGSLTTWSKIASGGNHRIATKTDGTLWSWGKNAFGQLGLGNITYYSSPKQVGSLTNWLSVSCGYQASFSIKTDGTLWSWGYNGSGQLGLGTPFNTTYYSSPKQVGSLTTWLSISSGGYHNIALQTNGTLWSWGANNRGQLGNGTATYKYSPNQIGALTTWSKSGTGFEFSFAIKTDGALWSWGRNSQGQLGLGNTTGYSSPMQIGALTTWLNITGGQYGTTTSIKTDGSLWSWGYNNLGQLGLNNRTSYSSPKQVGSLTTWLSTSGGRYNTLALG